ncbi:helix-turn-helix domain-containing protein [Streptomyces eurythermus]
MSRHNTDAQPSDFTSLRQGAAYLGRDPRTVVRMIQRGDLTVRTMVFGRTIRLHRGDLAEALNRARKAAIGA